MNELSTLYYLIRTFGLTDGRECKFCKYEGDCWLKSGEICKFKLKEVEYGNPVGHGSQESC